MFQLEVDEDKDLRLSVRMFRKCLADKKRYCAEVSRQPGLNGLGASQMLQENEMEAGRSRSVNSSRQVAAPVLHSGPGGSVTGS